MYSSHCYVWRELSLCFFTTLFTGQCFSCACLTSQVTSWSDELRQGKGCGSLNQHSLHAFSVSSLFFLQRQRKRPQLPTCQEEMSHRQPLDFSQRLFCGCVFKATGTKLPGPLTALKPDSKKLYFVSFL